MAIAGVLYGLISLLADWPIWPGDPWRLPSQQSGDIAQTVWFLRWTPYAILHGHNLFTTNIINYPGGVDLAQNTGVQLLGVLSAPLTLAVNPIASLNLLRWLAFTLSALAAYAVLRKWTRWTVAAFVGGLIYGFSPYMVTQGSIHLDLSFVPLPPIIFYLLYCLLIEQKGDPAKQGLALGLVAAAQFFIASEILATTAIIAGIGLFFIFFLCITQVRTHLRYALTGLASSLGIALVLTGYPVYVLFHASAHYNGPAQGFNNVYNADLLGPILPTAAQLIAPHRLAAITSNYVGAQLQENGSYLGIPLIGLALYFLCRYWRRLWGLYLAMIAFGAFLLSLGPMLIVNGRLEHLPVNLPFRKLAHLAVIDNLLPVRFSLYVDFFVAIIIALGLDYYRNDLDRRRLLSLDRPDNKSAPIRLGSAVMTVAVLGSLIALLPRWPYRSYPPGINWAETTKGLAIVPSGDVVLTYPYSTPFTDQPMLWQALSGMRFKLIGSYALVRNPYGTASTFPEILKPSGVEAMLINSVTATPDPFVADLVATAKTIEAKTVKLEAPGRRAPKVGASQGISGRITSVNVAKHRFVVYVTHTIPVEVNVTGATTYLDRGVRHPSLAGVVPNREVEVFGPSLPGTVSSATVTALRQFIRNNHVNDVVIDMGLRDSAEVAIWMRAALGPPTRAGAGGEFWIDAPARLAQR